MFQTKLIALPAVSMLALASVAHAQTPWLAAPASAAPLPAQTSATSAASPSTATPGSLPPALGSLASFATQSDRTLEPTVESFAAGELIAVVGTDHILAGDMYVFIEPIIEKNRDRIRDEKQEQMVRAQLTRQVLSQYVEVKALYQEFFRDMVGTSPPKELADMKKQVVTRAGKIFYEKQVPTLFEKYEVTDIGGLEQKLREKSMSLLVLRNQFIEQVLSSELERKYIPQEFEVDRAEILRDYRDNMEKWQVPERARWRQLTIRFDRHDNRQTAERLIKNLGNQIFLGGKKFEDVAKESSEGFTADDGGMHDWTSRGSLKSLALENAIFSLPLNALSQVIEDDVGFHIIEVVEREAAHTVDLAVSQAEIRQSLSNEKRQKAIKEFHEKIMKRTPVWTRWPEDIPGSRPLSEAILSLDDSLP